MCVLEGRLLDLHEYKVLILVVTAVSALIVASPALQRLLVYPQTEFFTELWYLGPGHMAEDIPYNISRGESYSLFLGVANHLGRCAYYSVQVKFRNANQSAPDSFNRTSSSQPAVYNVYTFVADNGTWELPVTFSFDYAYDSDSLRVDFHSLVFNGETIDLNGYSTFWNPERNVFFGNLIFELWIYDNATGSFRYHERYVDLKFNMLV